MNKDLISNISAMMPKFSKGQKLIAHYIVTHYDKAAFMTAARLGQAVGVSESTVVRFASELGFDGYPSLQRCLQELIRNRLTNVQRLEITGEQIGEGDILERVLAMDINKIRRTLEETSRAEFANTVDALIEAKTVYIVGVRSASSLASFLYFYFNHIFDNVKLINANTISDVFEHLVKMKSEDVFVGISFPRYSKVTASAMKFAKDRGAKTIAITDSSVSPIAKYADFKLFARSDMASFVDSLVAPLSLINALIVSVGIRKRDEITRTYAELEALWDDYEVYDVSEENEGK